MVSETSVATAALAIAISALVIAAGQLVAQLFSTADGYRRCQRSVIGDWYKLVQLPFRWSSFRYEVKVTTPHFEIATMRRYANRTSFHWNDEKPLPQYPALFRQKKSRWLIPPSNPVALFGTPTSRLGTLCPPSRSREDGIGEDVPTWFDLLEDVHRAQRNYGMDYDLPVDPALLRNLAPICISRKTRSWDFMPPDIVRPVASTTVGCLITMAYRLGMIWTDFRPDEGKMRAMGGGQTFSTSIVRGMGLVVEYSTAGYNSQDEKAEALIPNEAADKMACGIIPSINRHNFDIHDMSLRSTQVPMSLDMHRALSSLRIYDVTQSTLEESMSHADPAHRLPAFTDLIGLFCDWLPIEGMRINRFENPFPFPLTTMGERPESKNVWRLLLNEQKATLSGPCEQVRQFYNNWGKFGGGNFETSFQTDGSRRYLMALFKKAFDETTTFLMDTMNKCSKPLYRELLSCHIRINASSVQQAEENIRLGLDKKRNSSSLPEHRDPIFTERAFIYAENVPRFVARMQENDCHDSAQDIDYEDVWWMMMMRLHAWTMSVKWVDREGVKIPSEYYDNPARVYIL